ncbi:hypothetical protein C8R43DRAFT_497063 [Mycena crocata]|nr:hypothetical protein C8R43DRAFT_497063 [Mycena crocata]
MSLSQNSELADALAEASRWLRTLPDSEPASPESHSGGETTDHFSIIADRTRVAEFQQKLASLKDVAQRLNLRCKALDDGLNRTLLVPPIARIPPEILYYIFTLALPFVTADSPPYHNCRIIDPLATPTRYLLGGRRGRQELVGPWLFGKVCQYWRALALSFPGLWSSITVPTRMWGLRARLLNWQLDRAAKAPLDILLRFSFKYFMSDRENTHFHKFLQRLVGASDQWRTIRLEFQSAAPAPRELAGLTVPLLEEVQFRGAGAGYIKNYNFFQDAPNLCRVVLSNAGRISAKVLLPWAQITTYKATYADGLTHFRNLSAALNVVECDIGFKSDSLDENIHYNGSITLPHLRRLVVTRDLFLDCVIAPALKELHVHGAIGCIPSFLRRSACALTHLTLFMCDASSSDVIHFLQSTPTVTTLAIDFLGPPIETTALISALSLPSTSTENICLNLTSLSWGDRHDTIDRTAFANMVESRWLVPAGSIYRRLRSVALYQGRLGMKANGRRLAAFAQEGMDVLILNARKGKPAMERWRAY